MNCKTGQDTTSPQPSLKPPQIPKINIEYTPWNQHFKASENRRNPKKDTPFFEPINFAGATGLLVSEWVKVMPMLFVIDILEPGVDRIELELGIEVYLPPKKTKYNIKSWSSIYLQYSRIPEWLHIHP